MYDTHLLPLHFFLSDGLLASDEDLDEEQGLLESHICPELCNSLYLETKKKRFWPQCFWGAILISA